MSEEEKEAYNFYKECNDNDLSAFEYFSEPSKKQIKYMETLLNLIEKQNNRLERLEKELEPIHKLGIPVETLVAEFERLEDLEDDTDCLKYRIKELEKENEQEHKVENKIIKILEEKYILKIKKLEEENIELRDLANKKQWISPCYVSQNYIPKSVIREKIEELRKKAETAQCIELLIFDSKRDVLEELLGDE